VPVGEKKTDRNLKYHMLSRIMFSQQSGPPNVSFTVLFTCHSTCLRDLHLITYEQKRTKYNETVSSRCSLFSCYPSIPHRVPTCSFLNPSHIFPTTHRIQFNPQSCLAFSLSLWDSVRIIVRNLQTNVELIYTPFLA
jgi:hypothetical protein